MNKLKAEERGCTHCGKKGPLELTFKGTWKDRKKGREALCGCFGNRTGCVFSLVKFPGVEKLERDKSSIHDWAKDFEKNPCRGCNVMYGAIHHINCDDEKCPKCGGQILTCNCNGADGHIFLDAKGSKITRHRDLYRQLVIG